MNDTILVTGADGFIGSHLTQSLLSQGQKVRALVQYNSFNSWGWLEYLENQKSSKLEVVFGDIRDSHFSNDLLKGVEGVIHLAALVAIPHSYHAPDSYIQTNVQGTLNLLQAARKHEIKKFVHTSTSEVYGSAQFIPITEEHPLRAQSPYAASKIAADQLAMSFYYSFDIPVSIIRPFNTYGPRQSARAVIPTIITQLLEQKGPIKLGHLKSTRDFNYIADTVDGLIQGYQNQDSVGECINIGSGFEISIGETAGLIADLLNQELIIEIDKKRVRPLSSEVERLCSDSTKAQSMLLYNPKYAGINGFRNGLEKTIEWFTKPDNLKLYKAQIYNQ